jgi:hypothetical protein
LGPSGKRQKESKFCFFRIRLDFHFGWTAKLRLIGPPTKLLIDKHAENIGETRSEVMRRFLVAGLAAENSPRQASAD